MKKDQKNGLNSFNRRNGWDARLYKDIVYIRDTARLNMPFKLHPKTVYGHGYGFVCSSHFVCFDGYEGKTVEPTMDLLNYLEEMSLQMKFKKSVETYDINALWGSLQRNHGFRMSESQRTVPRVLVSINDAFFNPYVLLDTYQCVDDGGLVTMLLQQGNFGEIFGSLMFKSDFGTGLALPLKIRDSNLPVVDMSSFILHSGGE